MGICVLLLELASHWKTVGVWGDKLWGPNARPLSIVKLLFSLFGKARRQRKSGHPTNEQHSLAGKIASGVHKVLLWIISVNLKHNFSSDCLSRGSTY